MENTSPDTRGTRKLSLARDGVEECARRAAAVLRDGGLVVGPTDTLYGVFCAWSNAAALERLYDLKGRDQEKKLLALIADKDMLASRVRTPPPEELARHWPGALTLVLPAQDHPFGWDSIAFRVPDYAFSRALALALGAPFYAPSANPQGAAPALTCAEAEAYFGAAVDLYIDGGAALDTLASTLVSCLVSPPKVLRQGSVEV